MPKATKIQEKALKQAVNAEWKDFVSKPLCWRCGGLMVVEQCLYLLKNSGYTDLLPRRCVQCGELVDAIILRNRRQGLPQRRIGKSSTRKGGIV